MRRIAANTHQFENADITPLNGYGHWVGWEIHWNEQQVTQELTEAVKARMLKIA